MRDVQLQSSLSDSNGWNFQSGKPKLWLGCDSSSLITTLQDESGIKKQWSDPLDALTWISSNIPQHSRWVGYLSYDLGRLFESLPTLAIDDLHLPLFWFGLYEQNEIADSIAAATSDAGPLKSSLSKQEYLDRVTQAIEYIRAGDVFQVNLSQRFTTALSLNPRQIWSNLPPASYGAYLDCGDHVLLSNSPELFLHVTPDRQVVTRPIKGTRPRLPGMEDQLLHSAKDQAELNMIVDLERNDLGRVCKNGSVKVAQPRTIETHPTVYHGVATIEGTLRDDVTFIDLLRATFPGGSISGAPKIRAMQIIEELEPVRRGPYCGAIGYLAADGEMQFNVAIRTMIVKEGLIHIPVGGGIVADSDSLGEYDETLVKAAAMFKALNIITDPDREFGKLSAR